MATTNQVLLLSMIRSFHIQNFKSLTDFKLDGLGQFGCLIGLNGAGKTTVLQALDFMAHLASGTVEEWLKERDWKRSDLTSKLLRTKIISFHLKFDFDFAEDVTWEGTYNTVSGRCTREEIRLGSKEELTVIDRQMGFLEDDQTPTTIDLSHFELRDSILAFVRMQATSGPVFHLKQFMHDVKSLELLAPHRMRMKSRLADDVGMGGEKLSGYIHGLSATQQRELYVELRNFYPQLRQLSTQAKRAGWAQISTLENYENTDTPMSMAIRTEAKHLNDGLLRILTIVAQTKTEHQFLLFDEIENGINPEKIGQLVHYLLEAKQQIMVTTHNPLILNFLPDEKAKESVFFLYRNRYGATKATRFYEIPEVAEKLDVLGPGEAFLDTSLEELVKRIESREEVKA